MARIIPDRFLLMLFTALCTGWLLPVRGQALEAAQYIVFAGVFLLFFLHGLRLPRGEMAKAARSWRVQAAMAAFVFIAMPLAGWALAVLASAALPPLLLAGLIYTAILPSTVQSAISYSSIAGGNVAASVIGAALSNLIGIVLTPALAALLLGAAGVGMDGNIVTKIALMLLLPFALGQWAQGIFGTWAVQLKKLLGFFDKGVILLAVYISFSGAVVSGALLQLDAEIWLALVLVLALLLLFAFASTMLFGGLLRLDQADRISLIFTGAHKSIATGRRWRRYCSGIRQG